MFTTIGLAGCGHFCFAGYSNNDNGGSIINSGNPPAACSPSKVNGTMRMVALKSPVCETCTAAARVEHVFVTVRSIQLRPSAVVDANSPDWLEIAPDLANEPRQIDLVGDAVPEIVVQDAIVPAGSYSGIRLQFFSGSPASAEELLSKNACGGTRWNCIVKADEQVEPLHLLGDVPELLITFQSNESGSLVVLPDARMDLRLSLEPRREYYFSDSEGWNLQYVLAGRAAAVRQRSFELENSASN